MFGIIYIAAYALIFSSGVRRATGDGLNMIAALIFGVAGTFGSTLLFAIGHGVGGYIGLFIGAVLALVALASATTKLIGIPFSASAKICAVCTAVHLACTILTMILLPPTPNGMG